MKVRRLAPLLLVVLAPSIPRSIGACSLVSRDGGDWYEEPILGDSTAPMVTYANYYVHRPESEGQSIGCSSSCGPGPGYVVLQLNSTDDRAPSERIGYRFAIVDGQPPKDFGYGRELVADRQSELGLSFDPDAGPFSFSLEVTAIDQNGNESEPVVLEIEDTI